MTQDEIIEMARQSGFHLTMWQLSLGCEASGTLDELQAFAKQVAQHEREACSSIASDYAQRLNSMTAVNIADAIRARGQA
jgi:hypothetical protein